MGFKKWLTESERNIRFATFASDGTVVVYINGVRYTYTTDAVYHNKWKRMLPYSPWKVLNQIKASGQLIDQEIVNGSSNKFKSTSPNILPQQPQV